MEIKSLFQRLEKSKIYLDFRKENKDAFFCAGFFILNFKDNMFEYSLDFRDDKQLFTFRIPKDSMSGDIIMQKEELMEGKKPLEKINDKKLSIIKVNIDDLKDVVELEIKNNKVTNKLNELISVIQNQDDKLVWIITAMAEGFVILSIQIDAISGAILKFEKKNLFDFMTIKKKDDLPK